MAFKLILYLQLLQSWRSVCQGHLKIIHPLLPEAPPSWALLNVPYGQASHTTAWLGWDSSSSLKGSCTVLSCVLRTDLALAPPTGYCMACRVSFFKFPFTLYKSPTLPPWKQSQIITLPPPWLSYLFTVGVVELKLPVEDLWGVCFSN